MTDREARRLERDRLLVVLATVAINVVGVSLLTLAPWSDWRTGLGLNLIDNALLLGFAVRRRDVVLTRLLVLGIVAGLAELPADAWIVDATGTLDYAYGGGPMIWRSPIWMPLAWEGVVVQFACIGMALAGRLGAARGALLTGLIGAVNIPFYEEMALRIHWWRYHDCRMLLHTPWYIIGGEFLIAAGIALIAPRVRRAGGAAALGAGIGAMIFMAYAAAYGLIEKLG